MKKLSTQSQLQDFLDAELGWRTKEIANMKIAVKQSVFVSENTIVRAAIPLLYAHWEGFVKQAATAYVSYVNNQGLSYSELKTCFIVFGLKKTLHDLTQSKKSETNIAAVEFLRDQLSEKARLKIELAINTESNLSSHVFLNILLSIGINPTAYEARFHLIDDSLLKRRNKIAHGEYLDLNRSDWSNLADEVLQMLRQIKTDIENAMSLSTFKR